MIQQKGETMSIFTNSASAAKEAGRAYTEAVLNLLGTKEPLVVLDELLPFLESEISHLPEQMLRRPEKPGKWSIIEVVQHLADSELVWAYRLRMVIAHDQPEITGYDQDLWAKNLNYREVRYQHAIEQLRVLRALNLRLIASLSVSQLQKYGVHNERGKESVAHMLKLYAVHDLVHRSHIVRIKSAV